MEGQSDEALARRARGGDHAAFGALVERYQTPAFNFAYRFLGDYDEATDAAQTGFVQLFTSLPGLDLSRPIRPWLFRTIRNRCIDVIRQRRTVSLDAPARESEMDDGLPAGDQVADADPLPDEVVERADLQQLLSAAIRRLPERYRDVVALRYTTDLTFGEVAAALEIPENTARIHFHRAKALLREALRELL
ncbi:MAG TPA: sigma-70 family RNA polymerase sigma factor [Chloroflexota bacterium]|nr:sigma-70 family RNA polymerase sigma factor [Chloroflexota bacterium]